MRRGKRGSSANMQIIYTDGGRGSTRYKYIEDNDCTVTALANAVNMPYEQAHGVLEQSGRGIRERCWMEDGLLVYEKCYGDVITVITAITFFKYGYLLSDFVREHPEGRFIVRQPGHVFAVVDGIVIEDETHKSHHHSIPSSPIVKAWRLIPTEGI